MYLALVGRRVWDGFEFLEGRFEDWGAAGEEVAVGEKVRIFGFDWGIGEEGFVVVWEVDGGRGC